LNHAGPKKFRKTDWLISAILLKFNQLGGTHCRRGIAMFAGNQAAEKSLSHGDRSFVEKRKSCVE